MSTKIYNGYKLPNFSLSQLSDFCRVVRYEVEHRIRQLSTTLCAELCTHVYDQLQFGIAVNHVRDIFDKFDEKQSIAFNINDALDFHQKRIKATNLRNPDFDFSFSFTVHVIREKVMAMLFTEQEALREFWEKLECTEEYVYYNNTDRPQGINADEWETRKNDWDAALNRDTAMIPSLNGFCVECYHPSMDYRTYDGWDKMVQYLPFPETRVNRLAGILVDNAFYAAKDLQKQSISQILQTHQDWSGSNERKNEKEKMIKIVASKIDLNLTPSKFQLRPGEITKVDI